MSVIFVTRFLIGLALTVISPATFVNQPKAKSYWIVYDVNPATVAASGDCVLKEAMDPDSHQPILFEPSQAVTAAACAHFLSTRRAMLQPGDPKTFDTTSEVAGWYDTSPDTPTFPQSIGR